MNDTRRTDRPADARRLLEIVRALACELRPGAEGIERLGLEHALERDFGLDSLARVELLTNRCIRTIRKPMWDFFSLIAWL